ncbi:MAG: tyrosine-type recombinase/integrase [Chloroflexi bacterium]|nr:tyrosine-type recombinase/integrase [Chloroflexota bacterium]
MAKRTQAIHDLEQGVASDARRQTVSHFLRDWLENTVKPGVRPRTYDSYESTVRLHLIPIIGDFLLADLSPSHVRALVSDRARTELSPRSVSYVRKVLHIAMEQAVALELIPRNPVSSVSGPRVPSRTVEPFTQDEAMRILDLMSDERLGAYVTLVAATGMRVSEGLGLGWDGTDLEHEQIHVRQQLARRGGAFTLDEPKSLHGRRTIQLPKFAADALRAHRDRQEFEARRAGDAWENELGLVFTTELGMPLHRRNILRWFQNLLEREGLPVRDLKALRHTVASLLHDQGASPRDVMEALGHSDIRITLNTYTSLFAERRRELADGMDAWRRSS